MIQILKIKRRHTEKNLPPIPLVHLIHFPMGNNVPVSYISFIRYSIHIQADIVSKCIVFFPLFIQMKASYTYCSALRFFFFLYVNIS